MVDRQRLTIVLAIETGPQAFYAAWLSPMVLREDERFCRMWEFYLAISEMSFRYGGMMVFQAQLAAKIDTVPITRDYLFEQERRRAELAAAE